MRIIFNGCFFRTRQLVFCVNVTHSLSSAFTEAAADALYRLCMRRQITCFIKLHDWLSHERFYPPTNHMARCSCFTPEPFDALAVLCDFIYSPPLHPLLPPRLNEGGKKNNNFMAFLAVSGARWETCAVRSDTFKKRKKKTSHGPFLKRE